jgi:hypothetical protein
MKKVYIVLGLLPYELVFVPLRVFYFEKDAEKFVKENQENYFEMEIHETFLS